MASCRRWNAGKEWAVFGRCVICERQEHLTRHHLIPRTRHHNKRNKRDFARATVHQVVGVCPSCHSQIHQLLSEKELEREYNTVERLRAHPELARFARWIKNRPSGFRASTRSAKAVRKARKAPHSKGDNRHLA